MKIGGLPVVDANKPLRVKITPRDIARGDNKNPSGCAAARAIMRQTHCTQARVHIGRVYVKDDQKKRWVRYRTPMAMRSEIISFDRGSEFAPGEYIIPPIQPSHRGDGKRRRIAKPGTGHGRNNPHKTKSKPHVVSGIRPRGANR